MIEFQTYTAWLKEQQNFCLWEHNPEHDSWLVVPHIHCPKVATCLDDSNWSALSIMLAEADPEAAQHECLYHSHWATDFEFYIVAPESAALEAAQQALQRLADYPILDEDDLSERENEEAFQSIVDGISGLTFERADSELTDSEISELASAIHSHMSDTNTGSLDQVGQDGGGGPDRPECEQALRELGWIECVDDIWRPLSETEPVETTDFEVIP